jgi:tetratricopeptide (TPR) repeat protein
MSHGSARRLLLALVVALLLNGVPLSSALVSFPLVSSALPQTASQPATGSPSADSPDTQLQKAGAALEKDDYETAATLLETYLAHRPTDLSARFNLALAYSMTQRALHAIEQYQRVLAERPDLLPAHLNLGMLLRLEDKYEDALVHLRKVLDAQPEHWTALTEMGRVLVKLKRIPEARETFEKALKVDPKNISPRLDLAEMLGDSDPAAAEAELRAVLQELPSEQEARIQLASLLMARSAPATPARDEALQLYEDAAKALPNRVDLRLHLADLYLMEKRPTEAIAHLEAARAAGKIPPEADQLLLEAYLESNQKGRAAELLPEMIAANPKNAKLYLALGSLRNEVKNYPEAASLFLRAVELDPASVDGWTNLASSLYLMKEYARALTALEKVAALKGDTAGTYFLRALCFDQLGGQQQAFENYQKFLSMSGGKNPDQQFQARERSRILERELKRKGVR